MAISNVQQNILTAMQQTAKAQLVLQNTMVELVAMWTAESMPQVTDADLAGLAEFAHVTAAELAGAKNAMDTISTAIGAYAAGTPATKLLKIVNSVP
jgi:predicted AAA+ superfamily ATPase